MDISLIVLNGTTVTDESNITDIGNIDSQFVDTSHFTLIIGGGHTFAERQGPD